MGEFAGDAMLRSLLRAYRVALELASRPSLTLVVSSAGRETIQFLSSFDLPILRYLLQRHIKARVASLRQAYSRRAATQQRPDQFAVELKLLEHMDQTVPSRASPWKLWTTLVTVTILTFGLGAQRSAGILRDQDWRLLDKLRESIVSIGSLSAGNLLPLIEQSSLALMLTIPLFVMVVAMMALLFLRDPFAAKRTLLTGGFRVKTAPGTATRGVA